MFYSDKEYLQSKKGFIDIINVLYKIWWWYG